MTDTSEHLLVFPLEMLEVGTQFTDWIPHITLMPWFAIAQGDIISLNHELQDLAYRQGPITAEIGNDARFGPNEDVPVQLIKPTSEFMTFHSKVLDVINASQGQVVHKQFVGDNYRPHITEQNGKRFPGEQLLTLAEFILVSGAPKESSDPRVKTVVSRFILGRKAHETAA